MQKIGLIIKGIIEGEYEKAVVTEDSECVGRIKLNAKDFQFI